jgi:hypothetical protein
MSELVAHVLGVVNAELDKLEKCFSWRWVRAHLVLRESKAVNPDRDGYERIAAKLGRIFMLENEPCDLPHILRTRFDLRERTCRDGTKVGHPRKMISKQRLPPRWHDHVLAMAKVMKAELTHVNGFSVDIGYTKDGPIVRALVDVIPIITGEHPSRAAIAGKLEK